MLWWPDWEWEHLGRGLAQGGGRGEVACGESRLTNVCIRTCPHLTTQYFCNRPNTEHLGWEGGEGAQHCVHAGLVHLVPLPTAGNRSFIQSLVPCNSRERPRFRMERNFGRVGAASAKPTHVIKCGYLMKQVCNHGPVRGWGCEEGARSVWWGLLGGFLFFPYERLEPTRLCVVVPPLGGLERQCLFKFNTPYIDCAPVGAPLTAAPSLC